MPHAKQLDPKNTGNGVLKFWVIEDTKGTETTINVTTSEIS